MQCRRKFERRFDRAEMSHEQRVEAVRSGPARGQGRLGVGKADRLVTERGQHLLVSEQAGAVVGKHQYCLAAAQR